MLRVGRATNEKQQSTVAQTGLLRDYEVRVFAVFDTHFIRT